MKGALRSKGARVSGGGSGLAFAPLVIYCVETEGSLWPEPEMAFQKWDREYDCKMEAKGWIVITDSANPGG